MEFLLSLAERVTINGQQIPTYCHEQVGPHLSLKGLDERESLRLSLNSSRLFCEEFIGYNEREDACNVNLGYSIYYEPAK